MSTEPVEYLADLLPDGHLSIPEKIRKKLERVSKKKVRVYIDLETEKVTKRRHPAFGIWADRLSEVDSGEVAKKLRKKLESRTDGF
ncbi:MAG: hypothetical protein A2Z57_07110 [Planctomycetes bacterium RIFCSPHIGHO2_12_39_6]|nr:MAG: hypothetical protein A2Z57_07110 [Planctomycetes bacterium RIFCSPHIGHO2_12_39_6]